MPAADTTPSLRVDEPSPAGWRMSMVLCHALMGMTLLAAAIYVLVQMHAFELM